jgi:integrase/recombinase XerD
MAMPRQAGVPILELAFTAWPEDDRRRWQNAFRVADNPFDDCGCAAHLAPATRRSLRSSYGIFLGFLASRHPNLLTRPPAARLDRGLAEIYVAWRRITCSDAALANDLHLLRRAHSYMCPGSDWAWLIPIAKRIAARAQPKPPRLHLVGSDVLYALGIELMDKADRSDCIRKVDAFHYRDGLIIALLAVIPLRRRTLAALRLGDNLIKSSNLWILDIPAKDTKTGRALEYPLSAQLSARIDMYLEKFRSKIPGAASHVGLWPSNLGSRMDGSGIYEAVRRRTRSAFGFAINLHRFRHSASTLWSIQDPKNVRGAKDLLGHASFGTTEKHYIMAQSRLAGRALARAIGGFK